MRMAYVKALKVIKDYPLVLKSGNDARKDLKGIGEKIALLLNKLNVQGDGSPIIETPKTPIIQSIPVATESGPDRVRPGKKRRVAKVYRPSAGSGAYAILVGMSRNCRLGGFLTKHDIQRMCQPYTETSFSVPSSSSSLSFTAWNGMTKLITEELVYYSGNPKRYYLTEEGAELANRLSGAHELLREQSDTTSQPDIMHSQNSQYSETASEHHSQPSYQPSCARQFPRKVFFSETNRNVRIPDPVAANNNQLPRSDTNNHQLGREMGVIRPPNGQEQIAKFHVDLKSRGDKALLPILASLHPFTHLSCQSPPELTVVLDNREAHRSSRNFFQTQLESRGVKVVTLAMNVGDMTWAVMDESSKQLIMLDYIIERKARTDLSSSIFDGRFKEQKHRLKKTGMNVIYLIEECALADDQRCVTAITQSVIHEGFFVKKTKDVMETVDYLAMMTNALSNLCFQNGSSNFRILNPVDCTIEGLMARQHFSTFNDPIGVPLENFMSLLNKTCNLSQRDIWIRQLLTLRGVSSEKALRIARKWSCLKELVYDLESAGLENGLSLLESCSGTSSRAKIGRALAKSILKNLNLFGVI